MKQIRTLKTLLLLMALTAGNAYADTYARYESGVEYKNMTFDLYVWYKEYGSASYYSLDDSSHPPYATLTGISGTSEEVVVPYSFGYGDHAFEVKYVTQTVSNNYVKKLTFRNNVSFIHQFLYYTISETGNLACPALEELVFECGVQLIDALQCPSLKDIYFKGSKPSFNGVWSKYFSVPTGQVTAHVAELTAEECDSLHENVIPWVDFKEVVPYSEVQETVDVTVTVSNGGRVRANNLGEVSNNSTKTIQLNKHSTFTFFSFAATNYQVAHVYVNGRDVYGTDELEWIESSSSWRYRLEDMTQEAYINVVGELAVERAWVTVGTGGKVTYTNDNGNQVINQYDEIRFPKETTQDIYIVPNEGYELDKYWIEGPPLQDFTNTIGPWALVPQDDGSYKLTLEYGFDLLFTFKQKDLITFVDDAVKAICLANWDTNGDNELSMAEAAAVTSLGEAFRNTYSHPVEIETFDELQYFTGLTTIGEYAFQGSGLTSVILPNSVQSISKSAFASCNLTRILLSENITSIGESAFSLNKSLVSIELPQSLETIGSFAFNETGLRTIYIPAGVTSIASRQFGNCKDLASIIVDKNNAVYDSRNDCNAIIVKASNTLQEGCRNTVIPDDVVAIGPSAFRNRGIPSLVIPESVTSIGNYAFMGVNQVYGSATHYMQRLELKWETPLQARQNMFGIEGEDYPKQCTLVVPAGKKDEYIGAGWTTTYFKEIVEETVGTSHRQTFVRKGGTGAVEVGYTYLNEDYTFAVDEGVTTVDLPSWNYSAGNTNAELSIEYVPGETVKVYRNNVDVTSAFGEPQTFDGGNTYYYYISDYSTPNTQSTLGFILRDPATWVIDIKSFAEQVKTTTIANPDGMEIVYARYYKDGSHLEENITEEYHTYQFDDSDRANTRFILLMVPMDENRPVRVLRDGVDVTYSGSDEWIAGDYVSYVGSLTDNNTWDITYDNSHRQTFVRKGGTMESSIYYETWGGDATVTIPDSVPTTVLLPPFDDTECSVVNIFINVADGEQLTVLRNGVPVTEQFDYDQEEGYRRYFFYTAVNDLQATSNWGYSLRDPATWVIDINDGSEEESLMAVSLADGFPSVKIATTFASGGEGVDEFTIPYFSQYIPKNSGNTYQLRVPLDDGLPVRVLCNGVDVTYTYDVYDENNGYLWYSMNVQQDALWEVGYDTSHRQTVVLLGASLNFSEACYRLLEREYCPGIPVGKSTIIDFPPYNEVFENTLAEFTIAVKDGETFKAFRNGVEVQFNYDQEEGYRLYNISDYGLAGNTQAAFGFQLRDPATWVIIVDDGSGKYDVNGDGLINVSDVTSLVNKILHP